MSKAPSGVGTRIARWIDAPSVSATERIHLRALQAVQLLFVVLWALTEIHGASRGLDRLSNLFLALATVASFWQLRRGRFRTSVALLLLAAVGSLWIALLGTGLAVQAPSLRYVVVPQLLAALTLGAGALWAVTGAVGAAVVLAAALDEAAGLAPPAAENPWLAAVQTLVFLFLVALILDRMGAVLRRALTRSLAHEARAESALGELAEQEREVETLYHRLEATYEETLHSLSGALDLRDRETNGHSERVVAYSLLLGETLGLSERERRDLRWGALLHDIGKIAIPDQVLRKPGALSDEEWAIVRRHPEQGFAMLRDVSYLGPALDVVRHHHERWDGGGYPDALAGEAIPRLARIFSVVDCYDAMASGRPYRGPLPVASARDQLQHAAGTQLDPALVAAFLAIDTARLEQIRGSAWLAAATA
jgi:Na+-transporting methylmalonyl-CoA/oxaloacetate decarboxylase gamma subunit